MAEQSEVPQSQEAAEDRVDDFRKALGPFVVAAVTTRMPMIFTDAQSDGNPLVFVNDSFLTLTGFSREAILGRELAFILGDVADRSTLSSIDAALESGTDGNWQLQCRRVDGSEFLASIYLSPVRDDQGITRQHFLSFVELGGQIDGLLTQRDELHAMYENAPGFIATTQGPDHRFSFANAAYERLVGRRSLTGLTVAEALPELAGQDFLELLDEVYGTGEPFAGTEVPITLSDADNKRVPHYINFVYQPVRAANGRITGLFCEGFDVTEQKLAQDEVLALQSDLIHLSRVSAMETMATTLAHELNQPLAAIVSYTAGTLRLIEAGTVTPGRLVELLQLIGESAERAGDLIRHLRSLTSRQKPARQVFDLQDAIRKCVRLAKLGGCEEVAIADPSSKGISLEGDPIQIQQVLINLLRNACEASRDAGHHSVEISVSTSDDSVTVAVTDSGAGVPADVQSAGFGWTTTTKPNGMGVGLSISRTIIEAHGGTLWLRSSGPDGSCFAFSLPKVQIAEHAPTRRSNRSRG